MILVSYYRYKGSSTIANIDEVCKLCRSTGYNPATRTNESKSYPIEYFARFVNFVFSYLFRFPIMPELISMIIGRLRADDIYNQSQAFPKFVNTFII